MKTSKILIMTFVLLILAATLTAGEGSGGYAGAFLRIPVGARPAGLGNAFVSVSDDANAMYYNPGGLIQIEKMAFAGMYSLMSMDRKHFQGIFISKLQNIGSIGLAINGFQVGNIDGRDSQGNPTETFENSEFAFTLAFARELLPRLGIGGSAKYLSHVLYTQKASGLAFDLGMFFKAFESDQTVRSIALGGSLSNLAGKYTWDTASELEEEIPMTLRFGGSAGLQFSKVALLASLDIISTTDEKSLLAFGLESWFSELLGIRAGLYDEHINFGASFRINNIEFDYAYCPDVLDQGATSKLAIQLFVN
ncbi:PorV/PorQ family protein [candidate division KSB1 bacterium]|nr:PorV/PorQ family protein [candidate division KSB1 bacterium]